MSSQEYKIRIAFNPLIDAAPIIIANELGFFEDEGIIADLEKETDWSIIYKKLSNGEIDAAQLLAPIPFLKDMGINPEANDIISPLSLGANGCSFVLSNDIFEEILHLIDKEHFSINDSGNAMRRLVSKRKKLNLPKLNIAIPFLYSSQNFMLKHWLFNAGLEPDEAINIIVAPPVKMSKMLEDGIINGYCASAPWPQISVLEGVGRILFSDPEYWSLKPEKTFSINENFYNNNSLIARAAIRAIIRGAAWCTDKKNKDTLIEILAYPKYLYANPDAIALALSNSKNGSGIVFDPKTVSFPWISQAKWFIGQFYRWGYVPADLDIDTETISRKIYRTDIWCNIAKSLGYDVPIIDEKPEGGENRDWQINALPNNITMPKNTFYDGGIFRTRKA